MQADLHLSLWGSLYTVTFVLKTPKCLYRLENITRANIRKVVISKWVKTFGWTVPLTVLKGNSSSNQPDTFKCFYSAATEAVQEEGWEHEAQLHAQRGPARDGSGQTQRHEHQRGKTRTWRRTAAEFCVTPRCAETPPPLCVLCRAPTRSHGRSCVMAATSCVWMPFPSSRPRRLQRSSVMWAAEQTISYHFVWE